MWQFGLRMVRLTWGLFLFSVGVVITMNAHIGYAPWDVFHAGLAKTTGTSIGTIAILAGIIVGIMAILLGEKVGIGTIFNMVLIGVFLDIIIAIQFIPIADNLVLSIFMLFTGLFVLSLGTYFYMKTALGAGPRDSLMVALTRKTGLPIGVCRGMIEFSVVMVGWKLGGMVGIGTVLASLAIGFCIQITFRLLKFDATKVKHETINRTCKMLFRNKEQKDFAKQETLPPKQDENSLNQKCLQKIK